MKNLYSFKILPVSLVEKDANQPRDNSNTTTALASLKSSIERYDIQQPIIVTEYTRGRFKIIDGHRRFMCAKDLGYEQVPCVIYPRLSEGELEARRYEVQNIRRSWKPIERSDAILRIKQAYNLKTNQELAQYIGISTSSIADYLELRNQQIHLLSLFAEHKLSSSYQLELTRLKPHLRKVAGFEADEIIRNIIDRISKGVITNSKDIRIIKSAFIRIDLYESALAMYLRDPEMKVKTLEQRISRTGLSRDIQGLIATIQKRKKGPNPLSRDEQNALKRLVALTQEVLRN